MDDVPSAWVLHRIERLRGWVDGVCISGGEPTLRGDLIDLINMIREHRFPIKLFTNGSRPSVLHELLKRRLLDAVSMDIKAPPLNEEAVLKPIFEPRSKDY